MSASEFYLAVLLGGFTFISFVLGFATGFLYGD